MLSAMQSEILNHVEEDMRKSTVKKHPWIAWFMQILIFAYNPFFVHVPIHFNTSPVFCSKHPGRLESIEIYKKEGYGWVMVFW